MKINAVDYIKDMYGENVTHVYFTNRTCYNEKGIQGKISGEGVWITIEEFIENFGEFNVTINGDFLSEDGYMYDAFIRKAE